LSRAGGREGHGTHREELASGYLMVCGVKRHGMLASKCIISHKRTDGSLGEDRIMDRACKWAYERLQAADFLVLDTETTGLHGEVIDLAIVDAAGRIQFDTLIKPVGQISAAARAVHHIDHAMLSGAPTFAQVWPQVSALLVGKIVVAYNADFDFRMITSSLSAHHLVTEVARHQQTRGEWHCLMRHYAQHVGAYRWPRLEVALKQQGLPASNTHRAHADARAAYALLTRLASQPSASA
jgi:DNA polymerase-3 subunit epsilon